MIGGACCLCRAAGVSSGHRLAYSHTACCGRARGRLRSPRPAPRSRTRWKATSWRGTRPAGRARRRGWPGRAPGPAASGEREPARDVPLELCPQSLAPGLPAGERGYRAEGAARPCRRQGSVWNAERGERAPRRPRGSRLLPASAPLTMRLFNSCPEGRSRDPALSPRAFAFSQLRQVLRSHCAS